ncbi:TM2 domain containing protein [Hyphomicrobium denitrificans ATCC 51888]|uniref:TM2 domain containing protein n=1 Tax=Hyphomicrobium denitrificans (strain ATCC 51888 / DSM 1869 / NCIMB 11706 / TK 0415) TaxID=582899 RepID=D8JVD0_HYPDA|nr:TM2 domain-containing protein [Hyphomicrobium denitrificans]ADJ24784.1 TM2 domain containing protein [Hyphomicrobium denitrificans ATCC 51888]
MVQPTVTSDAHSLMLFEANKKSNGVAYALWLFLGLVGGHRFYANRSGSAFGMLCLFLGGLATAATPIAGFFILADGIWVLVDAFLIPGWIRAYNMDLVSKLTGTHTAAA